MKKELIAFVVAGSVALLARATSERFLLKDEADFRPRRVPEDPSKRIQNPLNANADILERLTQGVRNCNVNIYPRSQLSYFGEIEEVDHPARMSGKGYNITCGNENYRIESFVEAGKYSIVDICAQSSDKFPSVNLVRYRGMPLHVSTRSSADESIECRGTPTEEEFLRCRGGLGRKDYLTPQRSAFKKDADRLVNAIRGFESAYEQSKVNVQMRKEGKRK